MMFTTMTNSETPYTGLNHAAGDRGSVLTEFVIVVPLLLVFFLGITGVGQLVGNVTWISQTTYAGARLGADLPHADGPGRVATETGRLKELQYRGQIANQQGNWTVVTSYSTGAVTGKPIVNVSVDARISPLAKAFLPMDIGVSVAAPYLVPNQSLFAGLNDFANPAGVPGVQACATLACNTVAPYVPLPAPVAVVNTAGDGSSDPDFDPDYIATIYNDFVAALNALISTDNDTTTPPLSYDEAYAQLRQYYQDLYIEANESPLLEALDALANPADAGAEPVAAVPTSPPATPTPSAAVD